MKIKTYIELEIEVEADYTPGRPAPMVVCHDDPRYSDPGEDESIEITGIMFIVDNGKGVKVPEELMEYICDTVTEEVTEKCRDRYEIERDPMLYK